MFVNKISLHDLKELLTWENRDRDRRIVDFYREPENAVFLPQIVQALSAMRMSETKKDYVLNVNKTPRAGFTTNSIIASLIYGKKLLVVEPTNAIANETVNSAVDLYEKISGDTSKKVRKIPANPIGCSEIKEKLDDNPLLENLPFIQTSKCSECDIGLYPLFERNIPPSNQHKCMIKTMMEEKNKDEFFVPDILTVTYAKLDVLLGGERSEFFMDLMDECDVIFFDELGDYITKASNGVAIKVDEEIYNFNNRQIVHDSTFFEDSMGIKPEHMESYEMKRKIFKTIIGISNDKARGKMLEFFNEYIVSFINNYCTKTIDTFKNGREYPHITLNPLRDEYITVKGKYRFEVIDKAEGVRRQISDNAEEFVRIFETSDKETRETIVWIMELIQIMSSSMLIAYKSQNVEQIDIDYDGFNSSDFGIQRLNINVAPQMNDIVGNLQKWASGKSIFVTDATMPNVELSRLGDVIDVYFGDPAKSNSNVIYFYDNSFGKMGNITWAKDKNLRDNIFLRIDSIVKGKENDCVVWCPNKQIYEDVKKHFEEKGIETCEYTESENDGVLVSYYGSSFARGMSCSRRIGIAVGRAVKPLGSFKHVAYQYRDTFKPFRNREIKSLANNKGLKKDEYDEIMKKWATVVYNPYLDCRMMQDTVPDELDELFGLTSQALKNERIDMDTFQALNRTKDPMGKERSVVVCLGWGEDDVMSALKWGNTKSVCHANIDGKLQRVVDKQDCIIPPPQVVELSSYNEIDEWMKNGKLNCEYIGFNVDLMNQIRLLGINWKNVLTSEEVWMHVNKNMKVGETNSNSYNGYFVGSVRAFMIFDEFSDVAIIERKDKLGKFLFYVKGDLSKSIFKIRYDLLYNITEVLKVAYGIMENGHQATCYEIENRLRGRIPIEDIVETIFKIQEYELLRGSTWELKISIRKNRQNVSDGRLTKGVYYEFNKKERRILRIEKKPFDIVYNTIIRWEKGDEGEFLDMKEFKYLIEMKGYKITKNTIKTNLEKIFKKENKYKNEFLRAELVKDKKGIPLFIIRTKINLNKHRPATIKMLA